MKSVAEGSRDQEADQPDMTELLRPYAGCSMNNGTVRSCLHCVLARALRAELVALESVGLRVRFMHSDPVWLPCSGASLYRPLRSWLRGICARAASGVLRLTVFDSPGKSHVEVLAAFPGGRDGQALSRTFPRCVLATLHAGFLEGDYGE